MLDSYLDMYVVNKRTVLQNNSAFYKDLQEPIL